MTTRPSTLVTVTGRDRPGVTSALFSALARHDTEVLDVEQVVIRGRLILGVLVSGRGGHADALTRVLDEVLRPLGMDVEVSVGDDSDAPRRSGRSHVTVVGHPLRPGSMAGLAGCIADYGGNIDRIVRIARYPVTAVELEVSGAPPALLQARLAGVAAELGVDVAVERFGLHRRAKRLVVMDVDSTLVQGEVIELLADRAGCAAEVAGVTDRAMRGEIDFADSLRARVALLAGLPADTVAEVSRQVPLAPGARTFVRTLKRLDFRFAVVSGGFTQVTDRLCAELGIDYAAANLLEEHDGRLTGRVVEPVLDRAGKARALEDFARRAGVPLGQTVAVGDGANDLDMLGAAGLGIAFNAKPVVREAADTALNVPYLDAVLYLLGISREDVENADAEAGVRTPAPAT